MTFVRAEKLAFGEDAKAEAIAAATAEIGSLTGQRLAA